MKSKKIERKLNEPVWISIPNKEGTPTIIELKITKIHYRSFKTGHTVLYMLESPEMWGMREFVFQEHLNETQGYYLSKEALKRKIRIDEYKSRRYVTNEKSANSIR